MRAEIAVASLLVLLLVGAGLLAWLLGEVAERRYSKYYVWVSEIIGPLSTRLYSLPAVTQTLPYRTGFDGDALDAGWQPLHADWLQWRLYDSALVAEPRRLSVWIGNQQAPYFYRVVDGDFVACLRVRVRKASDPTQPPDFNWQFGGMMVRDPRADAWFAPENNLFAVVGHRGERLELETKSTRDGSSNIVTQAWPGADAELRILRQGPIFTLSGRPPGSEEWQTINRVTREDLPSSVQLGLIVYAADDGDPRHDLRVFFDELSIEKPGKELP